jgi:competence protein ComQ
LLPSVAEQMNQILDEYVEHAAFKALLKSFIAVKAAETTRWSEITQNVHFMFAGKSPHIERLGALTEMMILALDIMDDIQDQDNVDILWMTCPQGYALNAIVALLMTVIGESARLETVPRQGIPSFTQEASRILIKALEGQFKDLSHSNVTEADYMELIQEKSGSLIRLACYMGYADSSISAADMVFMNELAYCIGVISQIDNDIQDVVRFDVKNDLLHKKKTLPILFLLAEPDEEFPFIQEFYEGKLTEEQFIAKKKECISYIIDSGCIEYSRVIQQLYRNEAQRLLSLIDADSIWKDKFAELTLSHLDSNVIL